MPLYNGLLSHSLAKWALSKIPILCPCIVGFSKCLFLNSIFDLFRSFQEYFLNECVGITTVWNHLITFISIFIICRYCSLNISQFLRILHFIDCLLYSIILKGCTVSLIIRIYILTTWCYSYAFHIWMNTRNVRRTIDQTDVIKSSWKFAKHVATL